MSEHHDDEALRNLLAGDDAGSLAPDEAAELALLADLLGDQSTWAQPRAGLEDAIVNAVENAPAAVETPPASSRRHRGPAWRWRVGSAAAVAAIAVGAIVATLGGGASPDFTAQLAATEAVPGAHASVDITRNEGGFRVVVEASGLAPLPSGQCYEAWLKNGAGTLVPVGTFSSSDDDVTLWSGVSPADFPTMTVTIEPVDNNQASSGHVVLTGSIQPKG
jgi:anti-sigma-K factor RskA